MKAKTINIHFRQNIGVSLFFVRQCVSDKSKNFSCIKVGVYFDNKIKHNEIFGKFSNFLKIFFAFCIIFRFLLVVHL